MANSDLSEFSSELIRKAVRETIENKLKSNDYTLTVRSASQAGDNNFIGIVYRVAFRKAESAENEKDSTTKIILKVAPENVARRAQFFSRPSFIREIYMYEEVSGPVVPDQIFVFYFFFILDILHHQVLPFFRHFEQSKGVIEDGFYEYPQHYGSVSAELSECVLLEDLSVRNFSIIDRHTEEVTADHVYLFMKVLAKLHAISFALKDQQPEKFKEIAANVGEIIFRREDVMFREYFLKQSEEAIKVVSNAEDAHLLAKLKKLFTKSPLDIVADCLDTKLTGAGVVITHGDSWQNNTMFRYGNDGKPIEINFLDWQLSRCSSPIIDIVYFLFSCTTKHVRDAHYDNFLKVYHESLSLHIRRYVSRIFNRPITKVNVQIHSRLGSDPDKLFPYKLMMEHFRKFAKFAMVFSTVLLPLITTDSGSKVDLDELSQEIVNGKSMDANVFISNQSEKRFHTRLRDVIIDMVRLEYI